ncbi:multiple inositol polyphosphate phosphatase 1-like [Anticarsia gemmatalis]|uniref:multiple inositol polyphosphate phosphatase 1-like n=1 Tax=Anticarsia gemmatalis TaxID=129554 RepID=UPI003F776372
MRLILSIVLLSYLNYVTPLFCYWNTGCPYRFFGTKTPYNMVRGDIRDSLVKLTDCEPVSVWGLIRHGKMNPSGDYVKQMKDAMFIKDYVASSYEHGNSSLCAQDVESLQNWTPDKGLFDKDSQLSEEGYQEMVGLGKRLRKAFSKLLEQLSTQDYTFRSVNEKVGQDSIKGFVEGFGNKVQVEPPKSGYDSILPYATCGKYIKDVKHNNDSIAEAAKYQASSEFLASKDRIQRRLGIDNSLSEANYIAIWDFCRFTSSGINNKFSPWCALFTTEDLKVMEYADDLREYYSHGYGTPMNKLFGEIAMAELLKSFRNVKEGNGKKIEAYITRASTMEMVYAALGLFKDASPLPGNARKSDRKWRTSKFAGFASNLIAVLNKCGKKESDDYNVVFYLNEEPLRTLCKEGVCTWKEFEDRLAPFLNTNLDFCEFTVPPEHSK